MPIGHEQTGRYQKTGGECFGFHARPTQDNDACDRTTGDSRRLGRSVINEIDGRSNDTFQGNGHRARAPLKQRAPAH